MSVRGFSLNQGLLQPPAPNSATWEYVIRVKEFNAAAPSTLETNINNWLATLPAAVVRPVILGIISLGLQGNQEQVLLTYGYFTQIV